MVFVDFIGKDSSQNQVALDFLQPVLTLQDAAAFLFTPDVLQDPVRCLNCVFLTPKNVVVDEFNAMILQLLATPERTLSDHCCPESFTQLFQQTSTIVPTL